MEYTEEELNLITLCSFADLTYKDRREGCKNADGTGFAINGVLQNLIKKGKRGVYNKVRENFFDPVYREKTVNGLKERGIVCLTLASESYPPLLRHIPDPPIVLYCMGNAEVFKRDCFSVVGSRHTPVNMLAECRKFAAALSEKFTVVTGSADGGDTAALEGAGNPVSVLAYGLDYVNSASNVKLLKRVAHGGLLVTEYSPQTKPQSFYFPVRNRIIAGISAGTLVVSAGKKSGALITAGYAADYGREVFAFPYGIGSAQGAGCNKLIKDGAALAENPLDIFSVFGIDLKSPQRAELTDEETRTYNSLAELGEAYLPELAAKLGVQPFKLAATLSSLEIKGLAVRLGGNRYGAI